MISHFFYLWLALHQFYQHFDEQTVFEPCILINIQQMQHKSCFDHALQPPLAGIRFNRSISW